MQITFISSSLPISGVSSTGDSFEKMLQFEIDVLQHDRLNLDVKSCLTGKFGDTQFIQNNMSARQKFVHYKTTVPRVEVFFLLQVDVLAFVNTN
jgi:hypothetical protein